MSGRSAHTRKKAPNLQTDRRRKGSTSSHQESIASSLSAHAQHSASPLFPDVTDPHSNQVGTGVCTTDARSPQAIETSAHYHISRGGGLRHHHHHADRPRRDTASLRTGNSAGSSCGGSSSGAGHRDEVPCREPTHLGEASVVEKSDLRSMMDKSSDRVRKGLAKTFTFRKKTREFAGVHDGGRWEEDCDGLGEARALGISDNHGEWRFPQNIMHNATGSSPPLEPSAWSSDNAMSPTADQISSVQAQWPLCAPPDHRSRPASSLELAGLYAAFPPPPNWSLPSPPPETDFTGPGSSLATSPSCPKSSSPRNPCVWRWAGNGRQVTRWKRFHRDPELWSPQGDVLVYLCPRDEGVFKQPPSFRISSDAIKASRSQLLMTMLSESVSRGDEDDADGSSTDEVDNENASYRLYLRAPPGLTGAHVLQHHATTRNVFALLQHASLVGTSMYITLTDLLERLNAWMPMETDNVAVIISHLLSKKLDDVRNSFSQAVSLLAWSEHPLVRWEEGRAEFFAHAAGMYESSGGLAVQEATDWKRLSPATRRMIKREALVIRTRLRTAEQRLEDFGMAEMWRARRRQLSRGSALEAKTVRAGRRAAAEFTDALFDYYTQELGAWPPFPNTEHDGEDEKSDQVDGWLTRTTTLRLAADFGALYEYMVDRDVRWDVSEARAGRKWLMTRSPRGELPFDADEGALRMADLVVEFDNASHYPHVPHPYPCTSSVSKGRLVRREHGAHGLVQALSQLELDDDPECVTIPSVARKGRWLIVYAVLQILASAGTDAEGVKWRDGVEYHLCASFGETDWEGGTSSDRLYEDGELSSHERAYCWATARECDEGTKVVTDGAVTCADQAVSSSMASKGPLGAFEVVSRGDIKRRQASRRVPAGDESPILGGLDP